MRVALVIASILAMAAAALAQKLCYGGIELRLLRLAGVTFLLAVAEILPPKWRARSRSFTPARLLATAFGVWAIFVYPARGWWSSSVFLLAVLGLILSQPQPGDGVAQDRPRRVRLAARIVLLAVSSVAALVLAEVALRSLGTYCTWGERNGSPYASPYGWRPKTPWVFVFQPNSVVHLRETEFELDYPTNSEGLPDIEHDVAKPPDEYRIAAIGDSFTMGQGARFEDNWVRVIERDFEASPREKRIRCLCGGVQGSDPIFEYQLLRNRLLKYRPDLVLLVINGSDVLDVISRGGMDRYEPDGVMRPRAGPWFEPLFARSHVVRALFVGELGYDDYLVSPDQRAPLEAWAVSELASAARATHELGTREGFETLVVLHPFRHQVREQHAADEHQLDPLRASLAAASIPSLDLFPYLKEHIPPDRVDDYFWPIDGHCKKEGYALFARAIEERLPSVPRFPARVNR